MQISSIEDNDSSSKFEADNLTSGAEIWVPAWSVLCFEIKK